MTTVKKLLEYGTADVSIAASRTGHTPLHVSTRQANVEISKMLLDAGAAHSAVTKQGFTPLHLAAFAGSLNLAKLLLENDADLNARAKNGLSPLHLAAQTGSVDVLKYLLEENCDLGFTKSGCNVVHVSAHHGNLDILNSLLKSNRLSQEDINCQNNAGMSPLHHAAQQGHTQVYQMLVEGKELENISELVNFKLYSWKKFEHFNFSWTKVAIQQRKIWY